jgi:hypothetical protein
LNGEESFACVWRFLRNILEELAKII